MSGSSCGGGGSGSGRNSEVELAVAGHLALVESNFDAFGVKVVKFYLLLIWADYWLASYGTGKIEANLPCQCFL